MTASKDGPRKAKESGHAALDGGHSGEQPIDGDGWHVRRCGATGLDVRRVM